MSALSYYGREADTDYSVLGRGAMQVRFDQVAVDQAFVDTECTNQSAGLATKTYVDTADTGLAKKTYVDTQDALYLSTALKAATNGVASLDGSSKVPTAQLPAIPQRIPKYYSTFSTNAGSPWTITTTSWVTPAYMDIADPGWPYRMWAFGDIETRTNAGGDNLLANIIRTGGEVISYGTGCRSTFWHRCKVLPSASSGMNGTQTPYSGATTIYLQVKRHFDAQTVYATTWQLNLYAILVPAF